MSDSSHIEGLDFILSSIRAADIMGTPISKWLFGLRATASERWPFQLGSTTFTLLPDGSIQEFAR